MTSRSSFKRMLVLAALSVTGHGCASYINYPAIGTAEEDAAVNDPSVAPAPTVIQASLKRVVERFPVQGPYLVNLPQGMVKRRADEIVASLRDPNASLPRIGGEPLPVYHVTQVWVRPGDKAQVEILRPVFGVGNPGNPEQYQPITVRLRRSPVENWKIDSLRVWPIGSAVPPELYGWPEPPVRLSSEEPIETDDSELMP